METNGGVGAEEEYDSIVHAVGTREKILIEKRSEMRALLCPRESCSDTSRLLI